MKANLYLTIFFLICQNMAFGQEQVLLTDFRFIVNDTQEFPNYFDDENLTKAIYEKGIEFTKKKIGITDIEPYQAKDVEYRFRPPFRDNLNVIDRDKHDFFVAITSNAGIHTNSKGDKTYVVHAKVRIENAQNDTLFLNKSTAEFTLKYNESVLYDEAVITKEDFRKLFIDLMEDTFFELERNLIKQFIKPSIVVYNGFMKKAEKVYVKQKSKTFSQQFMVTNDSLEQKFMKLKANEMSMQGTIRVQDFVDILKFKKEFILKNNLNGEKLRIRGNYEEATDFETKVRYIKSTKLEVRNRSENYLLEFYPDKQTSWVYTLEWKMSDDKYYTLIANRYTNYIEIFSNNGLLGIIKLPSSGVKLLEIKNKEYTFFYKSQLSQTTKSDIDYIFTFFIIANQFMAEVAVLKQMPIQGIN